MLRDLDITFEVRPNQTYSIYLIELDNISRSYSLDRLNHRNIHKFNIFINPERIQQLQYGDQIYISDIAHIDTKRFELKFNLICKKNYDYDINFSSDISNNDIPNSDIPYSDIPYSDIPYSDHHESFNQQPEYVRQETNQPDQMIQLNDMTQPSQLYQPNQQSQNELSWANDKTYLLTLPSLEIRYI